MKFPKSEKIFGVAAEALELWYATLCDESRKELVKAEIEAVIEAAKKSVQTNDPIVRLDQEVFSRFATRQWQPETIKISNQLGFEIIFVEGKLLHDLDKRLEPAFYALKKMD